MSVHIGAGDDERIESLLLHLLEAFVILVHMLLSLGAALQLLEGEGMHVELRDLVALAYEAEELPLGRLQRRIGHHVEQSDMEFANILTSVVITRKHALPCLHHAGKGGKIGMGYQ